MEGMGRRPTEVAEPLGAERAGFWDLYVIECMEVNVEIGDQEEATW